MANKQALLKRGTCDEWETPQDLFDQLHAKFNFTLDPCATPENAKVKNFFTIKEDGLKQSWGMHRVFVNPPYSNIPAWVEKCCCHLGFAVMLLPARTDTRWFHQFIYPNPNCKIHFIKGRLKFKGATNSAPFPSMLIYFL